MEEKGRIKGTSGEVFCMGLITSQSNRYVVPNQELHETQLTITSQTGICFVTGILIKNTGPHAAFASEPMFMLLTRGVLVSF